MTRDTVAGAVPAHRPRSGEGVSDTAELTRLVELLRQHEAAQPTRPDVRIGEFLVDGMRVPLPFLAGLQSLTRTEAAALRLLGWGRANADIGLLLGMNESTVRSHLNNAVGKLGIDGMRKLGCIAGLLFHPLD
ncbi:regulatory protein, luxR family [Sphingomonas guangdongensis]|uniref:Regulatory protein, luxR family n=1 Tax=Sphingomonas guangdongensis TaxID=1141890 RepID=A0A285QY15_9SPHN|nr:helix-turn-helix transcriptional regulator [Sphingomonas guangdongensis]SOB86454.1 regulatory protein, luxR family [Sphingomonas guangdongensis]